MTSPTRTKQPDISITACSYSKVLEIISNKWTALVIYALEEGSIRYGEMGRRIEGISKKMLTDPDGASAGEGWISPAPSYSIHSSSR